MAKAASSNGIMAAKRRSSAAHENGVALAKNR